MKRTLVLALVTVTACGGIQTEPTCKVDEYGIIDVVNNTDEYKEVSVYRVVFDEKDNRHKTVGNPRSITVDPMTSARLRIHPGMVLLVIDRIPEVYSMKVDPWMKVFKIARCNVTTVKVKSEVVLRDIPKIQSRRALQCPPCEECPPCPQEKR